MAEGKGTRLGGAHAPALEECALLSSAVDAFIRGNSNFESSVPVNEALEVMQGQTGLQEIFATPIQHKLLTMDGALTWALFLHTAPKHAIEGGDPRLGKFSEKKALAMIATVYDLGMEASVWEHFEEDSDDEDSDEDSTEGSEDGGGDPDELDLGAGPAIAPPEPEARQPRNKTSSKTSSGRAGKR
jgi:hypothetical protein